MGQRIGHCNSLLERKRKTEEKDKRVGKSEGNNTKVGKRKDKIQQGEKETCKKRRRKRQEVEKVK